MANMHCLVLGMCLLVSCKLSLCQVCFDTKCELIQNLTGDYWKDLLPDCPGSGLPVDVGMHLWLRQVVDLDEPKQLFTTNVWISQEWNDCRLRWNPADFNGIYLLYFPYGSIWTPDITLYDDLFLSLIKAGIMDVQDHPLLEYNLRAHLRSAFGGNIAMSERKFYQFEVYSSGRVKQKFPTLLKSVCGVDTTYFPFDKQTCPLKFGPWVYEYQTVNFTTDENGTTKAYVENAEWVLNAVRSENTIMRYHNHAFTEVIYYVEIQRRPAFFMLTLFFPCFLISTMALLGFFLPPSSGQKVGLQLTLLLSLTVFEFLTLTIVPPNSKPLPLMCVYFALVMGLSSLSCVLSVVVMKIHMKGEEGWKVSPLARTILVEKLGRLLRVKRPHLLREHAQDDLSKSQTSLLSDNESSAVSDKLYSPSRNSEGDTNSDLRVIVKSFQKVADSLSALTELMEKEKAHHESADFQDWVTIASVLDRLFLILYILLSVFVFLIFTIELTS